MVSTIGRVALKKHWKQERKAAFSPVKSFGPHQEPTIPLFFEHGPDLAIGNNKGETPVCLHPGRFALPAIVGLAKPELSSVSPLA